ncbi:MAG: D-glycero-beta-D-manno-heptose-7-phosphate kinase [Verrucomicrobia bacterium]|nr:D-glycero-beta-D-manno-heptose-7-phosphate kinase [Verrucomicrobiota bacterium]
MSGSSIPPARVRDLVAAFSRVRVLVVGDVMLDRFVWGTVNRISPEAPVPVVEFVRESAMPGGAANVARNLTALGAGAAMFGVVGPDAAGRELVRLLGDSGADCSGIIRTRDRMTSIKTRVIAQQQQVVRVDRESRGEVASAIETRLLRAVQGALSEADAVVVGDYGKGTVTQNLLDGLRRACRERGRWLSLDPKPVRRLDLSGLSLITPNRKEAFELAGMPDPGRAAPPLKDSALLAAVGRLLEQFSPALLLVTLGEQGMLLCQRGQTPHHIPTVAHEVFDVSGAGDTVIATFTLAVAAGASPLEAAILSNHAAGVVVGKVGTAVVTPQELLASFRRRGGES